MNIETSAHFAAYLKDGPYAWPGGYPLFYITSDCVAICPDCANNNQAVIESAINDSDDSGWRVVSTEINWEDESLYCDHCGESIPSAYGES